MSDDDGAKLQAAKKYRIWITGYPDSFVEIDAENALSAMRIAAPHFRSQHHGEILEMNASTRTPGIHTLLSRSVRIHHGGRLEIL